VNCSEFLSNRVFNIRRRYTDRMKFVANMVLHILYVLLLPFFIIAYMSYVLYTFVSACKLCIFIAFVFMCYYYVCSVL